MARLSGRHDHVRAGDLEPVERARLSENGATADRIDAASFVVPLAVVDVSEQAAKNTDYQVTRGDLEAYEKKHGELKPGDVVILHSGWSDKHYKPLPAGSACMDAPLNGKAEGWPALGPEAMHGSFRVTLDDRIRAGHLYQALCGGHKTGTCPFGLVLLDNRPG